MKPYKTARVFAALFLGVLYGLFKHFQSMRWLAQGRSAFLSGQANVFDSTAKYHSIPSSVIAYLILAAVVFGVYELTAIGFANLLPASSAQE
jgi:hypothetical protein